jgi:hypothetical protein
MPSEYGMRLRKGYREWATVLSNEPVRTIIPFEGQGIAADKLWAVTEDGIYNVTTEGTKVSVPEQPFDTPGGVAGWGVWTEFTNDATSRFLFYADEGDGLWEYDEDTETWARPTITGPTIEDVAYVTTWKNRLWFVEREAGDAWYMAPDSKSGQATKFTFGSKFQHGGDLRAIYNWTVDGGSGIDDHLVAVSSGGDVLVYKGFDPAIAPESGGLTLVGSFFIGEVPNTRRLAESYGGELYLLSTYGLISLRDLLQGVDPSENANSPSAKINRFLRQDVIRLKEDRAWAITVHPADGFLQIIRPYPDSEFWENDRDLAIQYNQNLITQAWGAWQRVPVNCATTFQAEYFFGDQDGRVFVNDGTLDRVTLDSDDLYQNLADTSGQEGWVKNNDNDFTLAIPQALAPLSIRVPVTTVPGATYRVVYEVYDWTAGVHIGVIGTQFFSARNTGNGIFTVDIVANVADDFLTIVGQRDGQQGDLPSFSVRNMEVYQLGNRGDPIPFNLLTSYQGLNDHSISKRVGMIRAVGVAGGSLAVTSKAFYDYEILETIYGTGADTDFNPGKWDISNWDQQFWDSPVNGANYLTGASGMGRAVAIGSRGESDIRITLVGWDLSFTSGGYM